MSPPVLFNIFLHLHVSHAFVFFSLSLPLLWILHFFSLSLSSLFFHLHSLTLHSYSLFSTTHFILFNISPLRSFTHPFYHSIPSAYGTPSSRPTTMFIFFSLGLIRCAQQDDVLTSVSHRDGICLPAVSGGDSRTQTPVYLLWPLLRGLFCVLSGPQSKALERLLRGSERERESEGMRE